jgi:hypothetical protein
MKLSWIEIPLRELVKLGIRKNNNRLLSKLNKSRENIAGFDCNSKEKREL